MPEHSNGGQNMDAKSIAKLAITFTFLPLLSFLIIYGMTHEGGAGFIGLGLAMISTLGLMWGNPLEKKSGS